MTQHQAPEVTSEMAAIIERLCRKRQVYNGRNTFRDEFVNPDGPEIAKLLTRATQPLSLTVDDEAVARLREALEDAERLLALVEHPAIPDPTWSPLVQGLGERIGYGNLMTTASALWRNAGIVPGGEFVAGPCMGSVRATLAKARAALALVSLEALHAKPLSADMTRALPGGAMDDSTFEAIEEALDRADAPSMDGVRWLTLPERIAALLDRLQSLSLPVGDSETCVRCGGGNPSWSAPSPLWNAVMRGGSINGDALYHDMVCVKCFMLIAEEKGIARGWRLIATDVSAELETVTPSGRVWDEQNWLWKEPAATESAAREALPVDIDRSGLAQEVDDISYAGAK